MDPGARQNALKTNGWAPKNILSKMDSGARENALKTKEWEPQNILSKLDPGARQTVFKTKDWEPRIYPLQLGFWRSPKCFTNKGMGAQTIFSPKWILALAKML